MTRRAAIYARQITREGSASLDVQVCTPVKGATDDGYNVPSDAQPGSTARVGLTITPQAQTGQVTIYSQRVTIVA